MNPFLNPLFASKIAWNYLTGIKRAWKYDKEKLKKYQDKALRKTLKYAMKVPLYRKKYREAGVDVASIRGIDDLRKLPLITKEDLIKGFPDEIVPVGFKKEKAYLVGTSGSSGRPMQMYKDLEYIMIEALGGVRLLHAYGINWRKNRITNIGDFSIPKTTDEECLKKGLMGNLQPFFSLKNYQILYTGEDVKVLMEKMDEFRPEVLIAYTSVLMGLATLKTKGLGKNVNPRYIISSGEVLDSYSRKYIENAFGARVMDLYATTEGGTIAFECKHGNMHINSDFVHVEILDKNGEAVGEGEVGSIVITRLYPGGTPIIRYTGLNDLASYSSQECDCGMHTPLLKSLEGRKKDAIVLPGGKIFPPATIPMPLASTAEKFGYVVKRFQFIQHAIDKIEIRIELDESAEVDSDALLNEIKKNYEKLADGVEIITKVAKVEKPEGMITPPLIISKIDKSIIEKELL